MSKLKLAQKLVDELGVSYSKAMKFIDDVGANRAESVVDDVGQFGSRSIGDYWRPALAGGAVAGGGALVYRQQTVEQAKALAEQANSYSSAVQAIVESDLPPKVKQDLIDQASEAANSDGGDGGGEKNDGDGIIPQNPQVLIVLLLVLLFAMRYALGGVE